MSKLTKKQKSKRKKIEYKFQKSKKITQTHKSEKREFVQIQSPFPKELSREKRISTIRKAGGKAKKDFDDKYPTIQKWFQEYDAIYLLSYCALYFLSHPEGKDPEVEGTIEFFPHYLEIMQAFALYQDRNFSLKPLMQDSEKLRSEIKEIGSLIGLRQFAIPENIKSKEEISKYHLRQDMITNTTAIRNWAYIHQMRRVIGDLSKLVKNDFEKYYGVDPFLFMETLFELLKEREDLLNNHLDKVRYCWKKKSYKEVIEAYNQQFPENIKVEEDQIEEIWNHSGKNLNNLKGFLACHSDLKLEKIYSFDLNHFTSLYGDSTKKEKIKNVLEMLSYKFGDLKDFNKDYIILDNPIHHRPFIKTNDKTYYSAVFGILPHLALGLLEDLIAKNSTFRKKYNDRIKPKYLEDEIERLFRLNFPSSKIFRGSLWKDPQNGKKYENDFTVVIDTFAIIVEAKSGSVTAPAQRGAPDRLSEKLRELIEEPSDQANRFITYLKKNKTIHTFRDKSGKNNLIDSSKINYYIPLGITFAHLGMISSNIKKLIEAGIIKKKLNELAPSLSLTDLESVFELLPLEAEKIHYFSRRREFEDHINYGGDEMDLLSFYLNTGFNIGEIEYDGMHSLFLLLESKNLDPYFVGVYEGKTVEKPKVDMTDWWNDLLSTIAKRKPKNWIETSFILLNFSKENQIEFEEKFEELKDRIKLGKVDKKHNWLRYECGPEKRKYLLIGYPYSTQNREERNNMIGHFLDMEIAQKVRGLVVIGVDLRKFGYPYSVLAGRLETDLFDNQFR